MSYLVVSLMLNFLVGFLSIMLFVQSTTRDRSPWYIVGGTGIYVVLVTFFCVFTTGWSSLLASLTGSCGIFWVGQPKEVCRAWGRAIDKLAHVPSIRRNVWVHDKLLTISDFLRMY